MTPQESTADSNNASRLSTCVKVSRPVAAEAAYFLFALAAVTAALGNFTGDPCAARYPRGIPTTGSEWGNFLIIIALLLVLPDSVLAVMQTGAKLFPAEPRSNPESRGNDSLTSGDESPLLIKSGDSSPEVGSTSPLSLPPTMQPSSVSVPVILPGEKRLLTPSPALRWGVWWSIQCAGFFSGISCVTGAMTLTPITDPLWVRLLVSAAGLVVGLTMWELIANSYPVETLSSKLAQIDDMRSLCSGVSKNTQVRLGSTTLLRGVTYSLIAAGLADIISNLAESKPMAPEGARWAIAIVGFIPGATLGLANTIDAVLEERRSPDRLTECEKLCGRRIGNLKCSLIDIMWAATVVGRILTVQGLMYGLFAPPSSNGIIISSGK